MYIPTYIHTYVHILNSHTHSHTYVSPHRERRESSRSLRRRASEWVYWLASSPRLARRFARPLCSTLHFTLDSVLSRSISVLCLFSFLALKPFLLLSLSSSLSLLPLSPAISFLPYTSSHVYLLYSPRSSTPFRLLPQPPPYPPNESAPTGALLASLSNPRVRLANTHTHTHTHTQHSLVLDVHA